MKTADADDISSLVSSQNTSIVPLRTVLQNFLNLVENYESQRSCGADAYEKEFQELKFFSENLKSDPDYQCKEGEKSASRKKNRYKDILPFDYTRVTLTPTDDVPGSDYINANFIKGASGSSAYIACQGPLAHTVNDFWKMVVECEVQVIVMACMEQESGKHKCEKYWVEEDDIEKQFGDVTVWLKKCRNVCPDFLVRTMRIRYTNARKEKEERNVCQFHYSAWPDHGIPNRVSPLLDMVRLIRDCQTSETLPVLVHCSAGCGRTGTICAIDYVWGLLRLGKLTADFSLFQLVKDMRRQRIAMVQTKDQYILVHRAVKELFQEQLKIIDAHIYANLDTNGFPYKPKQDSNLEEPTYETIEFDSDFRTQRNGTNTTELSRGESFRKKTVESATAMLGSAPKETSKPASLRMKRSEAAMNALLGRGGIQENNKFNGLGDEDEICVVEDNSFKAELEPPSATKSGLLRKPSIIKLKQFFERTPKDAKDKKSSTHLSRAKSDVSSSRFYSFTSSFGNKRSTSPSSSVLHVSKSKDNLTSTQASNDSNDAGRDKTKKSINGKPPLLAKPTLPIKRSKSLKLNTDPSNLDSTPTSYVNAELKKFNPGDSIFDRPTSGSPTGGFSSRISPNPIKVSLRQMETPIAQSIISSSVKPPTYTATQTTEVLTSGSLEVPPRKPSPPSIADTKTLSPNYVNIGYGGSKVKIGVAKEMEDINKNSSASSSRNKSGRKKYDTVNSRSFGILSSNESNGAPLTRSQSHVWQNEKLKLTDRIFSDDNLTKNRPGESFAGSCVSNVGQDESKDLNPRVMKVKPLLAGREYMSSGFVNPGTCASILDSQGQEKETGVIQTSAPTARENARPKANLYANFSLNSNDQYSLLLKKHDAVPPTGATMPLQRQQESMSLQSRNNKVSASMGNSSESSNSNTGTPRNSLPSTPSQSIDGLYSQHMKTNSINKYQTGPHRAIHILRDSDGININILPKPILKGSLSSSSESDDRVVDGAKFLLSKSRTSPLYSSVNPVSLSSTPKMTSSRTPLGIRERRNSFRQAVWKEAQNDGHQHHSTSNQNSMQQLVQAQTYPLVHSSSSSDFVTPMSNVTAVDRPPGRSRRDYEPIWPEDKPVTLHVSSTYVTKDNYESPSTFNGSATSSNYTMHDGHQTKPTFADTKCQVPNFNDSHFQHKLEEIKILLEGLNTLPPATHSNNSNLGSKSSNLKYHRSLKSPSRSQYLQQNPETGGLSCFSFKKTNSFESISDQFELTDVDRQPLVQNKSPFTFFSDAQQQRNNSRGFQSGALPDRDRYVENYSNRSFDEQRMPVRSTYWNDNSEVTPIPPPRTKAKRNLVTGQEYKNLVENGSRQGNVSLWTGTDRTGRQASSNVNLNKTGFSSNECDFDQQQNISNGNISANSPKPLSRAFGAFQATAASVRSKFANWAEPKDKSHGFKSQQNGESNQTDENGGFTSPKNPSASPVVLKSTSSGQVRTSKHQYL